MQSEPANEHHMFLSTDVASRRDIRHAIGAVSVSAALLVAILPFVSRPLARVPAFIPAYESALILSDLITATADAVLFEAKRQGRNSVISVAARRGANTIGFPNRNVVRASNTPGR